MAESGARPPETLAERFWSLAREFERSGEGAESTEPVAVVEHVLAVLDALSAGRVGGDLTVNTVSFLALLRQHEVKGDLLYASPEQARGEEVDERSLVFSVGVLLFERLTGRHPFGAEGNPQRVARIRRGEMASGVNYFPKVPAELRTVLVKAMGPFPEERYPSLAALRAELETYVDRARNPQKYARVIERERAGRATLPALPDVPGARDDDQTRLHIKAAPPRAARESRPPPSPSSPPPVAAPAISVTVRATAVDEPRRSEPPRRRGSPVLYMAIGAAAASMVFMVTGRGGGGPRAAETAAVAAPAPVEATAAAAAAATATAPAAAAAPEAAAAPATAPVEATAAAPATAPVTSPSTSTSTSPSTAPTLTPTPSPVPTLATDEPPFSADVGADRALAAVRTCIGAERTVQFGASLLYKKDGRSSKIFYGATQQLTPPELRCLSRTLIGLTAGQPPAAPTTVTYGFRLAPTGDEVKRKIAPQR